MKKIKYTFFFFLFLLAAVGFYIFSLDSTYEIKRSRKMKVPPKLIYKQISDLKNWEKWSPWKEKDSTQKYEYSSSTDKEGDYLRFIDFNGNPQKITNLTLAPDSLIVQSMGNQQQMQEMYWQIKPSKNETEVSWTVKGELPLMQRFYADEMEQMIGPLLTRGLERIEKSVKKDMEKHQLKKDTLVDLGTTFYLYQTAGCKLKDLGKVMDSILPKVLLYAIRNQIPMSGKPFTTYEKYDMENNSVIFSSCIPTSEKIETNQGNILTGKTPGGKYFRWIFTGDYKYLPQAWQQAYQYIDKNERLIKDETRFPFEIYTRGHTFSDNPADWKTELYIPVIETQITENTKSQTNVE